LTNKKKYVFAGTLAAIIISAIGNYIFKSMLRIVVDSIKNMDIVKEESCSILDNLGEAIMSKTEGLKISINYCNDLTLKTIKTIHQKCITENIFMPKIDDIELYIASKKQFFKPEHLKDSYCTFDAFILKFKMFELYQQNEE